MLKINLPGMGFYCVYPAGPGVLRHEDRNTLNTCKGNFTRLRDNFMGAGGSGQLAVVNPELMNQELRTQNSELSTGIPTDIFSSHPGTA
jgi:hypothetical protein